jgi:hypothetical protein
MNGKLVMTILTFLLATAVLVLQLMEMKFLEMF